MWTRTFLLPALERAGKAAVASFLAVASVGGIFDLASVSWKATGIAALSAAVLSLAMSVLSAGVGPKGSPSLVPDPKAAGVQPGVQPGEHRRAERAEVLPPPRPDIRTKGGIEPRDD